MCDFAGRAVVSPTIGFLGFWMNTERYELLTIGQKLNFLIGAVIRRNEALRDFFEGRIGSKWHTAFRVIAEPGQNIAAFLETFLDDIEASADDIRVGDVEIETGRGAANDASALGARVESRPAFDFLQAQIDLSGPIIHDWPLAIDGNRVITLTA